MFRTLGHVCRSVWCVGERERDSVCVWVGGTTVFAHGLALALCLFFHSFRFLKDENYRFSCRGFVEVKGKGHMVTYFLLGNEEIQIDATNNQNNEAATKNGTEARKLQSQNAANDPEDVATNKPEVKNVTFAKRQSVPDVDVKEESANHNSVNSQVKQQSELCSIL